MAGVENQIGIGSAQVLPEGPSYMPLVNQLARQKQYKDEKARYDQQLKKQNEKELYDLIGDNLNLKDFNPIIHDKVKKAQIDLAQKIKAENPSYADTYIAAQNAAGQLTQVSQGLNKLDQQIAMTKKEYEGDKRINSAAIEQIARKKILDQLNETGQVDPNTNYFDEALNDYPQFALTDKSDYTMTNFLPEEQRNPTGKYKEINKRGATDQYDWKVEKLAPIYYDFKDNGEEKSPTISTRSQPSGLKDENNNDVPMLAEDAYGRFKATPSNVAALNLRLQKKYGENLNLKSEEAEKLRRIEAYKDVERQKPQVSKSIVEKAAPERSFNFYNGSSGSGEGSSQINNVYQKIKTKLAKRQGQGQKFLPATLLEQDEKDEVLKVARNAKSDQDITQDDLQLIEGDDGTVRIFSTGKGADFIAFLGETATNLPRQADVKGKRAVVEKANQKQNTINKPKTVKQNGHTYTLNEKTGQYE